MRWLSNSMPANRFKAKYSMKYLDVSGINARDASFVLLLAIKTRRSLR